MNKPHIVFRSTQRETCSGNPRRNLNLHQCPDLCFSPGLILVVVERTVDGTPSGNLKGDHYVLIRGIFSDLSREDDRFLGVVLNPRVTGVEVAPTSTRGKVETRCVRKDQLCD